MIRKITANGIVASAIEGSTRWRRASAEQSNSRVSSPSATKKPVTRVQPSAESCRPDTGKIGVSMANQYLSRNARKKTGTATPMSDITIVPLSNVEPCRFAAR